MCNTKYTFKILLYLKQIIMKRTRQTNYGTQGQVYV
jgi:hypothetical protein